VPQPLNHAEDRAGRAEERDHHQRDEELPGKAQGRANGRVFYGG
jgi:hypothetical protein